MKSLEQNLERLGYECIVPNFPLTFKEFDYSALVLEDMLDELIESNLKNEDKINLIGHSTGGLVIRKFISETKHTSRIGRCVLIATPNKGSKLANLAATIKPVGEIYRTLKSLKYEYIKQMNFTSVPDVEIAAIAGNKNNLFLGNFIRDENDGRVELSSVFYPGLKDFITLPFGHNEIHHQQETVRWIDTFLKTGKFL